MHEAAWDRASIPDDTLGYLERVQVRECGENRQGSRVTALCEVKVWRADVGEQQSGSEIEVQRLVSDVQALKPR